MYLGRMPHGTSIFGASNSLAVSPRQFTFGIGTEEGIAMAPDGRAQLRRTHWKVRPPIRKSPPTAGGSTMS
jgi:hypothetical protein